MKKLFVFDIDGTIKPMVGPMPSSTVKAIQLLASSKDAYVCLATGRTYQETQEVAKRLNVSHLVTSGGSDVYMVGKRVYSYQEDLSEELENLRKKCPIHVIVSDKGVYSFHFPKFLKIFALERYFFSKTSSPYNLLHMFGQVKEITQMMELGKIHKLIVLSPYKSDFKYQKMKFGLKSYEFEDKSLGVSVLCEKLGDVSEIICFGDSRNDISLFCKADRSYAMKHGSEEVRNKATQIISMNEIAKILNGE